MTLVDAILKEDIASVRYFLRYEDVNQLDVYGFRPLTEAAIMENIEISELLLQQGADPNLRDGAGGTALHWAAENNNLALCRLLLSAKADPNACNLSGQPVLAMPTLRQQTALRQLLVQSGADERFVQDYINTKLLGHVFELIGFASIVDPKNQFVQVDFEGFFLEVTIGLVANALSQFQNHFAAREFRRFSGVAHLIVGALQRASELIRYQQYRVDIRKHVTRIRELINQEPIVIPVGYEGHAISFIKYGDVLVKCDRREDSRLYDNIMFYRIGNIANFNIDLVGQMIYVKQDSQFINQELDHILNLQPITELKIEAQVSGNCSWANMEAVIPALFFLILMQMNKNESGYSHYKTLALNYFHRWRQWNRERSLHFCIQSYREGDVLRKATKAEILAALLFQLSSSSNATDRKWVEDILAILIGSPYEYILQNYLRIYYYESYTEEGRRFYELLRVTGYNFSKYKR